MIIGKGRSWRVRERARWRGIKSGKGGRAREKKKRDMRG